VKRVEFKQNTSEWLKWRHGCLGASDANIIMGVSKFATPRQLWKWKTGKETQSEANQYITNKGHELEKTAWSMYAFENEINFERDVCGTHDCFDYISASFDGYSDVEKCVLEIKLLGREDFSNLKNGRIPKQYYPQLQQQMFVAGFKSCHFLGYNMDSKQIAYMVVEFDPIYCASLVFGVTEFKRMIDESIEPEVHPNDWVELCGDDVIKYFDLWLDTKDKKWRQKVIELAPRRS